MYMRPVTTGPWPRDLAQLSSRANPPPNQKTSMTKVLNTVLTHPNLVLTFR